MFNEEFFLRAIGSIGEPEDYLIPDEKKSEILKLIMKDIFDNAVQAYGRPFGPLDELVVEGLDEESIWEELQTHTRPIAKFIEKKTRQLISSVNQKLIEKENRKFAQDSEEDDSEVDVTDDASNSEDFEDDEEDLENEDLEDEDEELENEEGEDDDEDEGLDTNEGDEDDEDFDSQRDDYEDEEDDYMDEDDELDEDGGKKSKTVGNSDITKEELEMEAWLDAYDVLEMDHMDKEEKREKRAKASTLENKEWDDEDEEEDDIDIVQKGFYDSEDEEDEEDEEDIDPSTIKYSDFFEDGEEDDEDDEDDEPGLPDYDSENDNDEYEDDEDEDDEDNLSDEDDLGKKLKKKNKKDEKDKKKTKTFMTSYQLRAKELAEQISELESDLMANKSWEMLGEAKASVRPENSLLEVNLDVDRTVKSAPIVTQEFTASIEELIKKRIKDNRFDDPNPRKISSNALGDKEQNDDEELSQEKSKLGLGEIYAEEYAKKYTDQTEEISVQTQKVRDEVLSLFNAVTRNLDALSHFYFTARPVVQEANAKVLATQRSTPALDMEDITPFSFNSSTTSVAPEQLIEKKKGSKVSKLTEEELTREDRKKLRKIKKAQYKENDKNNQSEEHLKKKEEKKLLNELRSDKRVTLTNDVTNKTKKLSKSQPKNYDEAPNKSFANSSAFFSKLQQASKESINNTKNELSKKRKQPDSFVSSASVKL